jgi:hypothetical protein
MDISVEKIIGKFLPIGIWRRTKSESLLKFISKIKVASNAKCRALMYAGHDLDSQARVTKGHTRLSGSSPRRVTVAAHPTRGVGCHAAT